MKPKINIAVVLFLIINNYGICQDSLLRQNENTDTLVAITQQGVGEAHLSHSELQKVKNGMYRDNIWHRTAYITYYGDSIKIIDQKEVYQYGTYYLKEDGKYWKKDNEGNYIIVAEAGLIKVYYSDFTGNVFNERYHWKHVLL